MPLMPHWPLYLGVNKDSTNAVEKLSKILEILHNPQNKLLNVIHITGTNGKGSTASYISEILKQSGFKVGKYTSPHIHLCNERIQINNEMISDNDLYDTIEQIRLVCEDLKIDLTIFECTTLAMIIYFEKRKCDFNVVEVGMGGMLDATNVFDKNPPIISIITSVHLDHTKFLGNTPEEIAFQKCFIIKPNSICISAAQTINVKKIIQARCNAINTKAYFYNEDFEGSYIENDDKNWIFEINSERHNIKEEVILPRPSLSGDHQIINAALAVMSCWLIENLDLYVVN